MTRIIHYVTVRCDRCGIEIEVPAVNGDEEIEDAMHGWNWEIIDGHDVCQDCMTVTELKVRGYEWKGIDADPS